MAGSVRTAHEDESEELRVVSYVRRSSDEDWLHCEKKKKGKEKNGRAPLTLVTKIKGRAL